MEKSKLIYPQTELKLLTDNCCLFMCYLWCMGIQPEKKSSWLRWVVVENGEIAFNPLLNSKSVAKGKPCDARIIAK